ncbi:MAG: hypothetical protein SFY66_19170 [Oculatellaceae cyanobacterium bins.114]|nr:hypothetical protein [Oculatellaceae cyanobacterium bins.114]
MKRCGWIVGGVVAVVLGSAQAAQADEGLLEFDLPSHSPDQNRVAEAPLAAISQTPKASATASQPNPHPASTSSISDAPNQEMASHQTLEVSFELPTLEEPARPVPERSPLAETTQRLPQPTPPTSNASVFDGGSDSLVAKAVGSAEGTRTPDGGRTWAYYGHVDPGNGVWNLGSFSYQHGAKTPEEADVKQLRRLQQQAAELHHQAAEKGMAMTLQEELNGIDLANQSPAAALDRGYIAWLKTAHNMGLVGSDAILWARTRSYLDPDSGRWSAPGLGNNIHSITQDQERRMNAVNRAIALHQHQPVANEDMANRIIFEDLERR